jgi:hypothetical protein
MLPRLDPHEMSQRGYEYHTWISLCLAMGVEKYLELGSLAGDRKTCNSAIFAKDSGIKKIVCVDIDPKPVNLRGDILYVHSDSGHPDLPRKALDLLGGYPDAVFIDADHSENSVRHDFEMWWPKTRILLAFHDIILRNAGVSTVWKEVSSSIKSVEVLCKDQLSKLDPQDEGIWGGIGILFKEGQ